MLSQNERIKIVLLMAKFDSSPVLVQRAWRKEYNSTPPSDTTIRNTFSRFCETGNVADKPRSGRPSLDEEKVQQIREHFENDSSSSIRQASRELEIPYQTIRECLKFTIGMKTFHYTLVQQLIRDDWFARKEYCQIMLSRIDDDNTYLDRLCFSDEAKFTLHGKVNRHNCVIWGYSNPKEFIEVPIKSKGVNVWAAMFRNKLIGPYFFDEDTVNQENYLKMLKEYFVPQLRRSRRINNTHFQQDGAPPHWGLEVRAYLNEVFNDKWIGRSGPTAWPARSPDLTPLDFYLWGDIKERVYKRNPVSIDDLKRYITEEFSNITVPTIDFVFENMVKRFSQCIAVEGNHFQHILK